MPPCFFIFGFGYTAEYFAQKLTKFNCKIIGTTRDEEKIRKQNSPNYQLIHFLDPALSTHLKSATHILVSTPPSAEGDPVLSHYVDTLKTLKSLQWLGYLSSTSIYGDHQGRWVNELSSSLTPGIQGQLRILAEKAWMNFSKQFNLPLQIFRLAGIYGPQRNALLRLQAGKPYSIYKEGQFFSRIHVEDLVRLLYLASQTPKAFEIFNLSDDEPAAPHLVDAYASSLLNHPALPLVPYEKAELSPMEKEFYANNRRVSNAKIKEALTLELIYPSYREGLKALLKS
ncbi:MAG: SDR family oxidoreductase [Tatlockia sp.]|nr:SDR family oxidoreductase [Tatlockia sp.]